MNVLNIFIRLVFMLYLLFFQLISCKDSYFFVILQTIIEKVEW